MENIKPKGLPFLIFIPLLLLIFIRPFISDLMYPIVELYYQTGIILSLLISFFLKKKDTFKNNYSLPILLILAAYLISSVSYGMLQSSIIEIIKFISYISIFFLVSQVDKRQKNLLLKAIVIAGAIISLYSIYQYFWLYQWTLGYLERINSNFILSSSYARDILISKRAIGTCPSPNMLAGYLVMAFFISLSVIKNETRNKKWFIVPILIIYALILTKSIGAWLSLAVCLVILFFLSNKSWKRQKLILVILLFLICLVLTFIILSRGERVINLEDHQNPITQRIQYWLTATNIIKDHFLLGIGPGNFQPAFVNYKTNPSIADAAYAHNILLHQFSETGILGFMGMVLLIATFMKKYTIESRFLFLAGLAFILHNLIDFTYFIAQVSMFWWVILGLIETSPPS